MAELERDVDDRARAILQQGARHRRAHIVDEVLVRRAVLLQPALHGALVRAWARGRRTRNLYREDGVELLLSRRVDEMRAELGLAAAAPRPRIRDAAAVVSLALPMLGIMATPLLAALAILRALV